MKKILILSTFLILQKINAQGIKYDTCNLVKQYVGEWMYSNGNDTIRIYLRYNKDISNTTSSPYISDKLLGWHEYKSGNTIVESNYLNRFMNLTNNGDFDDTDFRSIIFKLKDCSLSSDTLIGSITDYVQAKEQHRVIATVNSTRTQIIWKQEHSEGYGAFTGARGMTLPKQFVLIKQ